MAQVQIITGVERRRRWSEDEKRKIVEAAFTPGANVSAVARQEDLHNSVIYRWRRDLHIEVARFAKVVVTADNAVSANLAHGAIEVAVGNGAHIRIPSSSPADLATAIVKALVRR